MKGESLRATPLRFVLVGVLVIAVGMAIWWTRSPGDELVYGSFSAPSYESVEALAAAADAIVEGVVDGVVGRELDYGTSNPDEQFEGSGVPLVFLEVTVLETLKGRTDNKIILGKIDAEILISPQSTPLRAGDQVLLFLVEQVAERDSPGVTLFDFYYSTLSLDVGVFDILPDGTIKPRARELTSTSGNAVFERAEIESLITGE